MIVFLVFFLQGAPVTTSEVDVPRLQAPPVAMSDADMPRDIRNRTEPARSTLELVLDKKGRVTACRVAETSGSAQGDKLSCQMARQMKFSPRKDEYGQSVVSTYLLRHTWMPPKKN